MKAFSLLLILISSAFLLAQEHKSIHQLESELYSAGGEQVQLKKENLNIIPLNKSASTLTKAVFGYLPDWEYSTAKNNLKYNLLTHIAAFDFVVSATGSMTYPSGWPWTDLINAAHAAGVKVVMTAVNFDQDNIRTLLTNTTAKSNFFNQAKTIIQTYSLDGINIDFEGPYTADRGAPMNAFMTELTNFLHAEIPGTEVSFAGPAINWSGWDLPGLADACDYIFIMGYDFYGSWSTTSGPSAPLTGGYYNITTTLTSTTQGYGSVVSKNPEKLILGVPYYGNKWTTKTSSALSEVVSFKGSTRFKDDAGASATYGRIWESAYQVPWYRYQQNFEWYQIWYDDAQSLGLKYDMAIAKKLKGVGMWALGYDGTRSELWDLIDVKFNPVVPVELVSFSAVMENSSVKLSWRTATELNNSGFDIERKSYGEQEFVKIGFVAAEGTGSQPQSYQYRDNLLNVASGVIEYRLKQIDSNGSYKYSEVTAVEMTPGFYELSQNFPNPFNPVTVIKYSIPEESLVKIQVFDILGNEAAALVNEHRLPGSYTVEFSAGNLAGGVYFYTITAGKFTSTKKMLLLK